LPHGAFDGKNSQRGLTLPTSTIRPLSHGAHSLHTSSRILPGVAATNAGNYDAAAVGQLLNFSAARMVNPCHRCTI